MYAANLGVNVEELLVSQPDSGEMALDVVDQLVRSSAVDVVVVDSVAALVPRAELEHDARLEAPAPRGVGPHRGAHCSAVWVAAGAVTSLPAVPRARAVFRWGTRCGTKPGKHGC